MHKLRICKTDSSVIFDTLFAFNPLGSYSFLIRLAHTPQVMFVLLHGALPAEALKTSEQSVQTALQVTEVQNVAGVHKSLYSHLGTLQDGDHFGEESCILGMPSTAAVVSRTFGKCLSLRGMDLDAIVALHMNVVENDGGDDSREFLGALRINSARIHALVAALGVARLH
jgi:hypothetical protein